MARLNMIVEGQTEETFANDLLVPHLSALGIFPAIRCVETSRSRTRTFRGGMISFLKTRTDLEIWMKQERHNTDAHFTTMFDLYKLPDDFPDFQATRPLDPYARVERLEDALAATISHPRFVPYIQLHEFEALVLSEPLAFARYYEDKRSSIDQLIGLCATFASPELIDDGPETAPSKRILAIFPDYAKPTLGPLLTDAIGLPHIRAACPHFDRWLTRLEILRTPPTVA